MNSMPGFGERPPVALSAAGRRPVSATGCAASLHGPGDLAAFARVAFEQAVREPSRTRDRFHAVRNRRRVRLTAIRIGCFWTSVGRSGVERFTGSAGPQAADHVDGCSWGFQCRPFPAPPGGVLALALRVRHRRGPVRRRPNALPSLRRRGAEGATKEPRSKRRLWTTAWPPTTVAQSSCTFLRRSTRTPSDGAPAEPMTAKNKKTMFKAEKTARYDHRRTRSWCNPEERCLRRGSVSAAGRAI